MPQLSINLSILDFKDMELLCIRQVLQTINLSILDFKDISFAYGMSKGKSINLSILDFKGMRLSLLFREWLDYKSIHIGF